MQIIGVYFVKQVENSLLKSYELSLNQRIDNLSYYIEQEYKGDNDSTVIKDDVKRILNDFTKNNEIREITFVDKSYEVVGSSRPYGEEIAGKQTTDPIFKRIFSTKQAYSKKYYDPKSKNRVLISAKPVVTENQEVVGAIYVVASMEDTFNQMKTVNSILASGTGLALVLTALLGTFSPAPSPIRYRICVSRRWNWQKGISPERCGNTGMMKSVSSQRHSTI